MRYVRVVICGLTNRGQVDPKNNNSEYEFYTYVNIIEPTYDIEKLTRTMSGVEIKDYPYIELFNTYTGSNVNYKIINDGDMWLGENPIHLFIESTLSPPSIGDYLWLNEELVKVMGTSVYGSGYDITVYRGEGGTIPKTYAGFHSLFMTGSNMKGNVLKTVRNRFDGLLVELYDGYTGKLIYPSIIKSIGVTDDIVVLRLESVLASLNIEIPDDEYLKRLRMGQREESLDSITIPDYSITETINQAVFGFDGVNDWTPVNLGLYNNASVISKYINKESFLFWLNVSTKNTGIETGENFKLKGQISDIIRSLEIITQNIIIWDSDNEEFTVVNIFLDSVLATAVTDVYLNDYRVETKIITEPILAPAGLTIEYNESKQRLSSHNTVSGGRSNEVTLKLNIDANEQLVNSFKDAFHLVYSRLTDYAICKLKIKIDSSLSDFFYTGRLFRIMDIAEYNTFQDKENIIYDNGLVLGLSKDILTILVLSRQVYAPLIPKITLDNYFFDGVNTVFDIIIKDNNANNVLLLNTGVSTVLKDAIIPSTTEKYFEADEKVTIWRPTFAGGENTYAYEECEIESMTDDKITFKGELTQSIYETAYSQQVFYYMMFATHSNATTIKQKFMYNNSIWR